LGFLGGSSIEQGGTANAGIHDLHFALNWVRDHIGQVRGDSERVTFWGSDAGAASALYLLTAYGGTQDPLFKRAILQSMTYQNKYNRTHSLEDMTKAVAKEVGCVGNGTELVACMRNADGRTLAEANRNITRNAPLGTFPFG
jgi:carboxylesterase type B